MGFGLTGYVPFVLYVSLWVLFLLVLFRDVKYGIYFLIPFFPFRSTYDSIINYPFGRDIVDFIILAMLMRWIVRKENPVCKTASYVPIALLFITTLLGVANGISNVPTGNSFIADLRLHDWKNYMMMPLLFVIVFNNVKSMREVKISVIVMVISVALQVLLYIKNNRYRPFDHFSYDNRDNGTFSFLGPNHLASFFVEYMLICLAIYFGQGVKGWFRRLTGITFLASIYPVLFLFSRGAYAGFLGGITAYAILRKQSFIILIAVILIFWQVLLPVAVVERINMAAAGGEEYGNIGNREEIWVRGMEIFKSNPLFGIGYRTFQYVTDTEAKDTHNMYISVLAEMGIVGLCTLLLVLGFAIRSGLHLYLIASDPFLKSLGLGFLVSTISLMVMNFFGDRWSYIMMQGFYWTFWALVDRGIKMSKEGVAGAVLLEAT